MLEKAPALGRGKTGVITVRRKVQFDYSRALAPHHASTWRPSAALYLIKY